MKTYTSTEIRKKFSDAYNSVRYCGEPIKISHHGDDSVVMMRVSDVYSEPTASELHKVAAKSGAFDEELSNTVSYEENNMSVKLGDIVLAPFPFSDYSVTKLRPAILVSSLPNDAWLVIYITSSLENQTAYDVLLEPSTTNNLKVSSVARVNRLTVIADSMIERQLGVLSGVEKKKIGNKLEKVNETFLNSAT